MKKYILLMILSITGMSCNDLLDLDPDGRTTMDKIFSERAGIVGYLNSCYGYCPAPSLARASYSDEAQHADDAVAGSKYAMWYAGGITVQNFGSYSPDGNPWASLYEGIRKCNVFLENMKDVNPALILATESEIAGWIAQARTLRALYYLQLIKRYGEVPVLLAPYETTHDYSSDRKSKFSEVVALILEDCNAALSAPSTTDGFSWMVPENSFGIMTRAIPYAIRSQAITYAASPYWSDGTYSWKDAAKVSGEALGQLLTNDYKLFDVEPDEDAAQNPYALYFISTSDDRRSVDKETIYQCGSKLEVWKTAGLPTTPGMTHSGPCPTQELIDCYEMAVTGEAPILGYSDADHLQPIVNEASGYDPANPYEGRDPRFYASIYYNGAARSLGSTAPERNDVYPVAVSSFNAQASAQQKEDENGIYYDITTTGGDPYFWLPVKTDLKITWESERILVSFDIKSTVDLPRAEIYFKPGLAGGGKQFAVGTIPSTGGVWKTMTYDMTEHMYAKYKGKWGKADSELRLDPTNQAGLSFSFRNMRLNIKVESTASTVDTYVGGDDGISTNDRRHTRTGYYLRKYNNWRSGVSNSADGAIRLFRLAEIYLNFAEAANRAYGPDVKVDLGNGIQMSAREAVDAVRARAGMPGFPSGLSKDDFEKKYRNERRVELAFEEHRYFDVRRWGILSDTDKQVTGMRIEKKDDGFVYTRIGFDRSCWAPKYMLYPLEQTEVNKMAKYTGQNWQNPDWN